MKRLPRFIALLILSYCWLAKPCEAQTLDKLFFNLFAPLDKSEVQSGILIHQTPILLDPSIYHGHLHERAITDSLRLSLDQFGLLYGQFMDASVGDMILPDPKIYMSKRDAPKQEVTLAMMAMDFDYIREDAVLLNLVEWKEGQMHDIANRSMSPYLQDTCFAFTALQQKIEGRSLRFNLPAELVFNNLEWNINKVEVDFDDGNGFQEFNIGNSKQIEYDRGGEKTILLKYTQKGKTYKMATYIHVLGPDRAGSGMESMPYDEGTPNEELTLDEMDLTIFSACEEGENYKLRKPLIVLEAFGGTKEYGFMFELLDKGTLPDNTTLKEWVNENEYDLIWVDYRKPFASIEYNADNFIKVIDWVNNRKHADGSSEPNTIIGASMGGLVTKLALLKMHNEQDKDAEVDRFFSYDSPFQGANFPIGIQAFIRDMLNQITRLGYSVDNFESALEKLDSDASKELIKERVVFDGTDFSLETTGFDALQARMTQLESTLPFSAITRHIALSNGADFGTLQESMNGFQRILHMDIEFRIPTCGRFEFRTNAFAATNVSTLVYERLIDFRTVFWCNGLPDRLGINEITEEVSFELPNPMTLDNAPGSMQDIGLSDLTSAVNGAFSETVPDILIDLYGLNIPLNSFCFVPTISSLNMAPGTNISTQTPTGGTSVSRWTTSVDASVISPYSDMGEFNQKHIIMTPRIAAVIADELGPPLTIGLSGVLNGGEIYNFGRMVPINNLSAPGQTPDLISENLDIQNGAELWINRDDYIGFVNTSILSNNHPQYFPVNVPGVNCEDDLFPVTVTTQSGGKIIIGEYDNGINNIGSLNFSNNSNLIINGADGLNVERQSTLSIAEGSSMTINPGGNAKGNRKSNIIVQGGSNLTIEPNGRLELTEEAKCVVKENSIVHVKSNSRLRLKKGAQLIIENGGRLEIDAGANIDLFWHPSTIHIKEGGELIINGDFNFDGYGFFQFDKGHIFTQNVKLSITGQNDRFIRLNEGAKLSINHYGVEFRNGEVEYRASSAITTDPGAEIEMWNMRFEGIDFDPANNTGLNIYGADKIVIVYCEFDNLSVGIIADNFNNNIPFNIWNTNFTNTGLGVGASQSPGVFINNCEFTAGDVTHGQSIIFLDMARAAVFSSTISGFFPISQNVGAIQAKNVGELYLSSTDISDNNIGLVLDDVPNCRIAGGLIENNSITGIHIPPPNDGSFYNETNLFLFSQAKVNNNAIGIHFEGGGGEYPNGDLFGMLTLDCAELYNNDIGVAGTDVILNIDAFVNSNTTDPAYARSNKIHGTGTYFQICYVNFGNDIIGTTIPAEGNYWGGTIDPVDIHTKILVKKSYENPGCIWHAQGHILDLGVMIPTEPVGCPEGQTDIPRSDPTASVVKFTEIDIPTNVFNGIPGQGCELTTTSTFTKADAVHFDGYNLYRSGFFDQTRQEFGRTASVSQSERTTSSDICKHHINIAKVMARGGPPVFHSSNSNNPRNNLIRIFPNPANQKFTLLYDSPEFEIVVFDLMGRIIHSGSYSYSSEIESSDWKNGLYLIEIRDVVTKELIQDKVIISK